MIDFSMFDSLVSVADYFVDEETCKQALIESRWGDDVVCPHCGHHHCVRRADGRFRCNKCKHNFSCLVITDELSAYNGLEEIGYCHEVVKHSEGEYANGNIFTNSIEGFWSHFRRMITGCYHNVRDEHLQAYIDEAVFRWNTRKMDESERFAHMFAKSIGLIVRWSEIELCEAA